MCQNILLKKINELINRYKEVAVPAEEYFINTLPVGVFIPNIIFDDSDYKLFLQILNKLKDSGKIKEVFVRICERDEDWFYTDTIYIYSTLTVENWEEEFGEFSPDEIVEGWMYGKPHGITEPLQGVKVFTLWWD
jgi:hypothetical protein